MRISVYSVVLKEAVSDVLQLVPWIFRNKGVKLFERIIRKMVK